VSHSTPRILVVDDCAAWREVLREQLHERGYAVFEAEDGQHALNLLRSATVDLILSDLRMPRLGGLGLLARLAGSGPPVVMFSAAAEVPDAVDAMRAGALDFLTLPLEPDELVERLRAHLPPRRSAAGQSPIVGEHPSMRELRESIGLVARRDVSVLITGESGVGKELVARELHRQSGRAQGPFVAVNCCALTESLLESELFGHERGAFTGALQRKIGRFERAHGGTLFLDEVGDAPLATQAKLLRALQERRFERVGGTGTLEVDVRVVAATNRELRAMRDAGAFREDLFHRLNVFPIHVPPLRERRADLPLIVETLCARRGLALSWTDAAIARLEAHPWPGNVRELENALERLAIFCAGRRVVGLEQVEQALAGAETPAPSARLRFAEDERARLQALLERLRWNVSAVARELGVSRGALRYRLRKHGLVP
jgi:two-component system NtrC family response regulator